jgi:hypothetical protein
MHADTQQTSPQHNSRARFIGGLAGRREWETRWVGGYKMAPSQGVVNPPTDTARLTSARIPGVDIEFSAYTITDP